MRRPLQYPGTADAAARPLQVSGKHLGELNHVAYCRRCMWVKLHLQHRLPFQMFPGIFSSIDSYTKRVVEQFLDRGAPPDWLAELGEIVRYHPPPPYQKFFVDDTETGIRLTGTVDGLFVLSDGSYLIVDYKTSRYSRAQDALRPAYEAQLNAYAWIAERTAWSPVSRLALVYMEPRTARYDARNPINHREDGFAMAFEPRIEFIAVDPDLVPRLLREARTLYDQLRPPTAWGACRDCEKVDRLVAILE